MDEWLSRTRLLFGDEPIKRLQNAHVLVVGVGGVGAYAAEMVVRAGIGALTIIDGDTVSESNLNRQLVALHSTLGKPKVEERTVSRYKPRFGANGTASFHRRGRYSCFVGGRRNRFCHRCHRHAGAEGSFDRLLPAA